MALKDDAKQLVLGTKTAFVKKYSSYLSPFEMIEIEDYLDAFYVPTTPTELTKMLATCEEETELNDEEGRYLCGPGDHVAYRYEVVKRLGDGTYGTVYEAMDHKRSRKHVALKIINAFADEDEGEAALFEIEVLQFVHAPHVRTEGLKVNRIINLINHLNFRGHLCLVMPLVAGGDLQNCLEEEKTFSLDKIQERTRQVVEAVQVLHALDVIHGDIKLDNVLLVQPEGNDILLTDFSLSSFETPDDLPHSMIQCCCCRAPEVALGSGYARPVDMWGVGCIVAEMYTGEPIFPAHTDDELIMYQLEALGLPDLRTLVRSRYSAKYFDVNAQQIYHRAVRHQPGTLSIRHLLGSKVPPLLLDFVQRCLRLNPRERMTANDALYHPFLTTPAANLDPYRSVPSVLPDLLSSVVRTPIPSPQIKPKGRPKAMTDAPLPAMKALSLDTPLAGGKSLAAQAKQPRPMAMLLEVAKTRAATNCSPCLLSQPPTPMLTSPSATAAVSKFPLQRADTVGLMPTSPPTLSSPLARPFTFSPSMEGSIVKGKRFADV